MKCKLKAKVKHTAYFWGPLSDIEGKTLKVISMSTSGDCLCMVEDAGLVDVMKADIEEMIMDEINEPLMTAIAMGLAMKYRPGKGKE